MGVLFLSAVEEIVRLRFLDRPKQNPKPSAVGQDVRTTRTGGYHVQVDIRGAPLLGKPCQIRHVQRVAAKSGKLRPLVWVGTSLEILKEFPDEVQDEMGYGLFLAQAGDKHRKAKPLVGFGGAAVLEMITDHHGDTYRAVYTVRLRHAVYALHAFQKKSKQGIETPKRDVTLIRQRLRQAQALDTETTLAGGKA